MTVTRGPLYDSYWRFAAARQDVYLRRLRGEPPPWTDDPVIARWRFTNVYRAADRVSQYLIRNVIYAGDQEPSEVVFRVLLFKWFNRISTWELLSERLGPPRLDGFDPSLAQRVLTAARAAGRRVYSAAYIVPPVPGEPGPKHAGHLSSTMRMLDEGIVDEIRPGWIPGRSLPCAPRLAGHRRLSRIPARDRPELQRSDRSRRGRVRRRRPGGA